MPLDPSLWRRYDASYRLLQWVNALVPNNMILRLSVRVINRNLMSASAVLWTAGRRHRGPNLTSLPLELLLLILSELNLERWCLVRQTCRVLYNASNTHCIWKHIFQTYSDLYLVPIYLPKPFEAYSALQLETIISKFACSHRIFDERKYRKPPPSRVVRRNMRNPVSTALIDGGRWLLSSEASDRGDVLYFDLDSQTAHGTELEASTLIQADEQRFPVTFMNAWVDHAHSELQFNLTTTHVPWHHDDSVGEPCLPWPHTTIWRVVETQGSLLSATKGSTFTLYPPHHSNTSLLGSKFAYWADVDVLEILDFEACNNVNDQVSQMSSLLTVSPHSQWVLMQLLPGERVIVLRPDMLSIYHVPRAQPRSTTGVIQKPGGQSPFFRLCEAHYPYRSFAQSLSRLQVSHTGVVQLIFASNDYFFSLTLDISNQVHVDSLIFWHGRPWYSYILAPHGSFVRPRFHQDRNPPMDVCALLRDKTKPHAVCKDGLTELEVIPPQFDNWSGRIVYAFESGKLVTSISLNYINGQPLETNLYDERMIVDPLRMPSVTARNEDISPTRRLPRRLFTTLVRTFT